MQSDQSQDLEKKHDLPLAPGKVNETPHNIPHGPGRLIILAIALFGCSRSYCSNNYEHSA
jgi:hypothetical protein